MKIGYARVSTQEQNEARQIRLLEEAGAERLFIDKASGKDVNRIQFREMLNFVREGDTVITESISRISRSAVDFLSTIEKLTDIKVNFISIKENMDTSTPAGKFMLTVFAALSQLERENILQRQKEGIEIAKEAGKYKGRQPIRIDDALFRRECRAWREGRQTATEAMKKLNLKSNTFYRRVKELNL